MAFAQPLSYSTVSLTHPALTTARDATGASAWFMRLADPRRRRQMMTAASAPATQEGMEVCFKQQAVAAQCLREEVMPPMHSLPRATSAALLLT